MFVPSGHRLFLLILISGLPEPNRIDREKRVLCPFLLITTVGEAENRSE